MTIEKVEKKEVKTMESEEFAEYLWRDFYEVKRRLVTVLTGTFEP